jgi:hypothetical protein
MAWKQGQILVAVDDLDRVRRFNPSNATWADEMMTGDRPQDVGVTAENPPRTVSANREVLDGSVSVAGRVIATTEEKSIALTVVEVARLTPDPNAHTFCWNQNGDTDERAFTLQNTRVDRMSLDLGPVTLGGSNPGNYAVLSDTCSAARLKWAGTCQFRLRFTASGPSVQSAPTFPVIGYQPPRWPATATISSVGAPVATATISLQGGLQLNPCHPLPVLKLSPGLLGGL